MAIGGTRAFVHKPVPRNLLIVGDSLSVSPGYPDYLLALMPVGTTMTVSAYPSHGAEDIYGHVHAQILGGGWTDLILLAGVNDLTFDRTPEESFYWITKMYADGWAIGAQVTGVSLTPWASNVSGATRQPQTIVHRSYCNANHYPWSVVNTSSMGDAGGVLLPAYDDGDGLHMSDDGKEYLAQLVYAAI